MRKNRFRFVPRVVALEGKVALSDVTGMIPVPTATASPDPSTVASLMSTPIFAAPSIYPGGDAPPVSTAPGPPRLAPTTQDIFGNTIPVPTPPPPPATPTMSTWQAILQAFSNAGNSGISLTP